ncbi:hypothetical protein Mgra_00002904, partial [Meloidogyne graminicola]
ITLQLRGILEIYKPLTKKLNFKNKLYENQINNLINYLESFEQILNNLNNFGIKLNIKEKEEFIKYLINKGNEIINEIIKNKIIIKIIEVKQEENNKYKVGNINEIDNWLKKKLIQLNL